MKMAVLLSGSGRTLDNFYQCLNDGSMPGTIETVISNKSDAPGLEKAEKYGYPAFFAADNERINEILLDYGIELVLMAGYLKLFRPPEQLSNRVLNIHPALVPAFSGHGYYGMRVHRAAYERGVKVSGCTVHFANQEYDEGPIVVQKCVALSDGDTPYDIADKVFAAECEAYPEAVRLVHFQGINYFWNAR